MEELKRSGRPARPASSQPTAASVDLPAAALAIEAFLTALGHPPSSDVQLASTGRLVAHAFHEELLRGYRMDPAQILADSVAISGSDFVVLRDLDITCMCPHHLLPASGVVHVGYVPNGKVVGLGALARLVECFSRRFILQETLCEQVADALVSQLGARGAGCIAELEPACLRARGEEPAHARVVSMASAGALRDDASLRREFLQLAGMSTQREPVA